MAEEGEILHERILAHLEAQKSQTNVPKAVVTGTKTTQGGRPIQVSKCPACSFLMSMSGHDPGEVRCIGCGTLLQFNPR